MGKRNRNSHGLRNGRNGQNSAVDQFIGEYAINTDICDALINLHKDAKQNGLVQRGQIGSDKGYVVDKSLKDSWDLGLSMIPDELQITYRVPDYFNALKKCVDQYFLRYPSLADCGMFSLVESPIIQHYPPGGGYFRPHFERTNVGTSSRMLVWMTYLNDVTDGGGTRFTYQGINTQARKGRTIIWPSDFTHTHHGIPSPSQDKYIITGWLNYCEN